VPLVKAALRDALEVVFTSPDATAVDNAQAWADAVRVYAVGVEPAAVPPAVAAAANALAAALAGAFAASAAVPGMEAAFATFAAALGAAMAPAFVAVPPAGPVGFASLASGPMPDTAAAGADRIAGLIDTWIKTGTATPALGGAAVSWS
jgi:hypothetical protein